MLFGDFFVRVRGARTTGFVVATILGLSTSAFALAETRHAEIGLQKLSDPARIVEKLSQSETKRVRVIIEVAVPALPDAATAADEVAADNARASSVRLAQDAVLERVFALDGGLGAANEALNLGLTRMAYTPHVAMTVDQSMLDRLSTDPGVIKIFEDRKAEPMLSESLPLIQMPETYATGATGLSRHIAILDTGGRRTHKLLGFGQISSAACYSFHDPEDYAFSLCPDNVSESTDINSANDCDPGTIRGCGHGSHVAGIAAGFNNFPIEGEPLRGVAWNARIISINVFHRVPAEQCGSGHDSARYPDGCTSAYFSDIQKGLERVYELRHTLDIDAVNMSIGIAGFGTNNAAICDAEPFAAAVDLVRSVGIAPVASAGNSFLYGVGFPACISSAIAVSAATKTDGGTDYSNWGELTDLVAPGSAIVSAFPLDNSDTTFASATGTSMAAPHVAGAFAVLRSVRPNDTVDQLLAALKDTGTAIGEPVPGKTLFKPRINVNDALTELGGSDLQPAEITSPSPGSTLPGSTVTFEWNAAYNANTGHWLSIGTSPGAYDIHDSGLLSIDTLSHTVMDLPTDGSTIYVRLSTGLPGAPSVWQNFNDYTYTASEAAVKAEMASPTPGSALTNTTATFEWTEGTGVLGYWLQVGTNGAGSANIFSGGGAQTSRTVPGLPASGTLNVRLMSYISGGWQFNDYTYTMDAATKAVMTSPTPGSTLTSTSATFNWTAGSGATSYWLQVGSNGTGSANIFSGGGAQTSRTVGSLPASGTLNVRLMSYIAGGWQFNDYTYTMNAATKAVMTSPTPGSTLTSTSATFNWTAGSGVGGYWLMVGTNGAGSANILSQGGPQTSRTVTGLPASGTLNVRLMSYISGGWQFNDYTYTMNATTKAVMTWPAPGATLTNPWASFQWTSVPSSSGYWLQVGTNGAGSANILSTGVSGTLRSVTGLPQVGTLNVRLMSYISGGWQFNDYIYTMAVPAIMTTPAPGSTLPGSGVMFQWTSHPSINNYWLQVGTNGAGSANIFSAGVTNSWRWVGGLPTSGQVNVRLMTWVGGAWRFRDYTYNGGSGSGMALEALGEEEFSSLNQPISLE